VLKVENSRVRSEQLAKLQSWISPSNAITLVARIATGSAPRPMYTAMMPPETCAMPAVMMVISSERVA